MYVINICCDGQDAACKMQLIRTSTKCVYHGRTKLDIDYSQSGDFVQAQNSPYFQSVHEDFSCIDLGVYKIQASYIK